MKRFIVLAVFLGFLSGCSDKAEVKVGILLPHHKTNTDVIWFHVSEHIKNLASGEIEVLTKSAGQNAELQHRQARELFEQDIDVLILTAVNVNAAGAIVREAHENDIEVVAFDRIIANSLPDYYVSFQYEKAGELMAEYALNHKPKGNYVLLWGDRADNNAVLIKQGQMKKLKPHINMGQVKVMYKTYISTWSLNNSQKQMENVLSHSTDSVDAVIASNDRIAGGAYQALKEYDMTDSVVITGMDADLAACRRIVRGQQSCTVYKSFIKQADVAYEAALKLARDEKPASDVMVSNDAGEIPARLLMPVLVDESNLTETVIKDGLFTKEQIYGK